MTVSTIDFCTTLDKVALHKIKNDTDLLSSLRGKVIYVGEAAGRPSVLSESSILVTDFPQVIFYRLGELGTDKDIKSFTGREQIQNKLFVIFEKSFKENNGPNDANEQFTSQKGLPDLCVVEKRNQPDIFSALIPWDYLKATDFLNKIYHMPIFDIEGIPAKFNVREEDRLPLLANIYPEFFKNSDLKNILNTSDIAKASGYNYKVRAVKSFGKEKMMSVNLAKENKDIVIKVNSKEIFRKKWKATKTDFAGGRLTIDEVFEFSGTTITGLEVFFPDEEYTEQIRYFLDDSTIFNDINTNPLDASRAKAVRSSKSNIETGQMLDFFLEGDKILITNLGQTVIFDFSKHGSYFIDVGKSFILGSTELPAIEITLNSILLQTRIRENKHLMKKANETAFSGPFVFQSTVDGSLIPFFIKNGQVHPTTPHSVHSFELKNVTISDIRFGSGMCCLNFKAGEMEFSLTQVAAFAETFVKKLKLGASLKTAAKSENELPKNLNDLENAFFTYQLAGPILEADLNKSKAPNKNCHLPANLTQNQDRATIETFLYFSVHLEALISHYENVNFYFPRSIVNSDEVLLKKYGRPLSSEEKLTFLCAYENGLNPIGNILERLKSIKETILWINGKTGKLKDQNVNITTLGVSFTAAFLNPMFIFGGLIQSVNMINNKLETDKEFAHHFKLGVAEIENSWKNIMQRYLPFYVRRSIENLTDIRAKFYRSINLDENFIRSEALLEKLSALETCLEFPTQSTDDISKNDIVAAFRESISQFDNKQPFRSF